MVCALPVLHAHRERDDRGNARIARAAVRVWGRGALPIELAMGSWERRHWGSLPPWETFFKVFSRWVRDAQNTQEHSDTPRYTRVPIRYTPRVFPLIGRTHKTTERTRAAALPGRR
jgi:hypothetical protein